MAPLSLNELTTAAASVSDPAIVSASIPKLGGVDPLGLRQINFDLMDQVLPGLNNVARHIRPFVVVTWAWHRARQIAEASSLDEVLVDRLRDFVDRIEVIYAWSQFARHLGADLPGQQVLAPLLRSERWVFGGADWQNRRENRRDSTAFTAPITYGPSLKSLGWVAAHREFSDVLIPSAISGPAVDAFQGLMADRLHHPAFSQFGDVEVTAAEVESWSDAWSLEDATDAEKHAMERMLLGPEAPAARRNGVTLMLAAAKHAGAAEVTSVRRTMAGLPSDFLPPDHLLGVSEAWRRLQVRQLFRLSLEALFFWSIHQVKKQPRSTHALVGLFLDQCGGPPGKSAWQWLNIIAPTGNGPTELVDQISTALYDPSHDRLAATIAGGLSFCIAEAPEVGQVFERADRLPLYRARREAEAWSTAPTESFVRHILESWVLAQHLYWAVGRGLADARARGKTIHRLRIVPEEEGWTMAPGAFVGNPPQPTPDRLETALSLATECGLLAA